MLLSGQVPDIYGNEVTCFGFSKTLTCSSPNTVL